MVLSWIPWTILAVSLIELDTCFLGPAIKVKEESKKQWRTRNLCFAKHRHSSVLKPASRFVLHTSAIILAAMENLVVIDWN